MANEPAPNFAEITGNVAEVLLPLEVNGKLQLCLGGFDGAQVGRGLELLQSDTWRFISPIRSSKYLLLNAVWVPAGIEVHIKVAPLSVMASSYPSSFCVSTTSQRLMNLSSTVVLVAPETVVAQPATTGVGVVVASVLTGGTAALVLSVVTAMTPVTMNRAVTNFFADIHMPPKRFGLSSRWVNLT